MTDPSLSETEADLDLSPVEDLMRSFVKGLRATQLYLPNNPVYQQAMANLQRAFEPVWGVTTELTLDVTESDLVWNGEPVLSQPTRTESVAWVLFKDGVRSITIEPGAEDEELASLLRVIQKARNLPQDAEDDLLTLLWEQDFQRIRYTFVELTREDAAPLATSEEPETVEVSQDAVREEVEEAEAETEQPERPAGVISLEDFDSTLYFLDERDIEYLKSEIDREYSQDLRGNILAILFDLLELQTYTTVRAELVSIIENFIPYLLGVGDFRSVAYLIREIGVILERARELIPEQRDALEHLPARLSAPDALAQLLQSLDEAVVHPTEEELGALFRQLQPEALETVLAWMPRLSNQRVRDLLYQSIQQIALAHPEELAKAMGSEDESVVLETVKLSGRLKLTPSVPSLGSVLIHQRRGDIKVAVVEALTTIGTPGAMQQLERAVEDEHRDVRVAAVRALAARRHRAVFPRIESAVLGKALRAAELTEKMVFFEAYGVLGGEKAVGRLAPMLEATGGFMRRKEDPEIRACAAMALGKIGNEKARDLLERAQADKDPLVRNAVTKALREAR